MPKITHVPSFRQAQSPETGTDQAPETPCTELHENTPGKELSPGNSPRPAAQDKRESRLRALGWAYSAALGIETAPQAWLRMWIPSGRQLGWVRARYKLRPATIRKALRGRFALQVGGLPWVTFVTLDLDAHELGKSVVRGKRGKSKNSELEDWELSKQDFRGLLAKQAQNVLGCLAVLWPKVTWSAVRTPNGLHLIALLKEPLPAALGAALAGYILRTVQSLEPAEKRVIREWPFVLDWPEKLEAFPRYESGGARTARLPLTGPGNRLLGPDLVTHAHRYRAQDVRDLLSRPRADLQDFGLTPADLAGVWQNMEIGEKHGQKNPEAFRAIDMGKKRPITPGLSLAERLPKQLRGRQFVQTMQDLLAAGIPDDRSYHATCKLAFLLRVSCGLDRANSEKAFLEFLDSRSHEATHCQTTAGRKQLLREFRSCLKHEDAGIAAGKIEPGGLADLRLLDAVRKLLPGNRFPRRRTK